MKILNLKSGTSEIKNTMDKRKEFEDKAIVITQFESGTKKIEKKKKTEP